MMLFPRPRALFALIAAVLSLLTAGAAESLSLRGLRSLPLRECRVAVVAQRLVRSLENNEVRWEFDEGMQILALTVRIDKPVGYMQLHASDFVLAYRRGDEERDDRSRCGAMRFRGTSLNEEGMEWAIPKKPSGYLSMWSSQLDKATSGYVELAFPVEDDATEIQLCIAQPVTQITIRRVGAAEGGNAAKQPSREPRRMSEASAAA